MAPLFLLPKALYFLMKSQLIKSLKASVNFPPEVSFKDFMMSSRLIPIFFLANLQQVDFSLSSYYILQHIFCRFDDGQRYYKISKTEQKKIEKCRYWCQKSIFLSTFGTSIGTFCRIVVAFVTSIVLAS